MFAVEPFLLRCFGTTPGKWMLGLSVESVDGGRLSLAEARERTSGVLWKGLGLSVPGVELATLIISCYKHSKGEELSWERGSELRLDRAGWRVGLYAAVVLLVLGLGVVTANAEISCETSYTGELRGSYLTGTEEDPATLNMRFTVEFENEETRTDN